MMPVNLDITPADLDRAINMAKMQRQALDRFLREVMVPGVDYDRVPGTDKPTLLKSGAELLSQLFRLSPGKLEILNVERDLERNYLAYDVGMYIIHRESGLQVAYGVGAANSYEKKYRWRKTKDETGDEIQIQNPDIMDQHNTLLKMAAKRAFVDGILKATGASRLFTQDMEDFGIPEAPSKKQIELVKKICKGKTEEEILAMFSEYLGRDVTEWSDITRQEVSEWIDHNKPANWGSGKKGSNGNGSSTGETRYSCSSCGKSITQGIHAYSTKNFGKTLCQECQGASQSRAGKPANSGSNSGLNWTQFWAEAKRMFSEQQIHDEARRYFNMAGMKSLTEVIKTQDDLSLFLDYLRSIYEHDLTGTEG